MEVITEQIRQTIIKEIEQEILEECIIKIGKEIRKEELTGCEVSRFYINGLTRSIDIIGEIKRERHL